MADGPIRFETGARIDELERIVANVSHDHPYPARVSTAIRTGLLAESWTAAALATVLRHARDPTAIIWGITKDHQFFPERFAATLPGLVAIALSNRIVREPGDGPSEDFSATRRQIEEDAHGRIGLGDWSAVVEFDEQRARSLRDVAGNERYFNKSAFDEAILQMRQNLDLLWPKVNLSKQEKAKVDGARENVTLFVKELFENAYEHGRLPNEDGNPVRNLRFMRFRKFFGTPDSLEKRAQSGIKELDEYLAKAIAQQIENNGREANLLEIGISDFGAGIVDAFLDTPAGAKFRENPRAEVLDQLLHTELTAHSFDASAGRGTLKALDAAQALGAFVSLRTNEFWWAAQFPLAGKPKLKPMRVEAMPKIAGTHWNVIWAPRAPAQSA